VLPLLDPGIEGRRGIGRVVRVQAVEREPAVAELAVVVDSYGLVSLTADRRPIAEELGLRAGSEVVLGPIAPGGTGDVPPTEAAAAAKGRASS